MLCPMPYIAAHFQDVQRIQAELEKMEVDEGYRNAINER